MTRTAWFLPALLGLVGCPEPPGAPPSGGGPAAGAPAPGGAEGGTPGSAPGGSDQQIAPGSARMAPEGWSVSAEEGVRISGTLSYAGTQKGSFRMDFLKAAAQGEMPTLMHTVTLEALGPWEVVAPKDAGPVTVLAFLDLNDNGPSPGEPKTVLTSPIEIGKEPITGIALEIQDDWDAKMGGPEGAKGGAGGPPPGGAGAGGPPPGGAGAGGPPPGGAGAGGPPPGGAGAAGGAPPAQAP